LDCFFAYYGLPVAIQGRRLAADGSLLGSSFFIAVGTNPAVAYSSQDDSYLVVWEAGPDIWARPVAANGTPGTAFAVHTGTSNNPLGQPAVVYSAANDYFVVAWRQLGGGSGLARYRIQSKFVWLSGNVRRLATLAEQAAALGQPAVATAAAGSHLIVWRDARNSQGDIYGQLLSNEGSLIGSNFVINDASGDKSWPAAVWNDGGDVYLVAWQYDGAGHVLGQRVEEDGSLAGDPITLSDSGQALQPALVTTLNGQWLAAWQEGNDLYARLLDSDGRLDGAPARLVEQNDSQSQPALAGGHEVQAMLVWQDNREGDEDIYSGPVILVSALATTTITYDYDPLYRLTAAAYTGAITATYSYQLDAVGNRLAYTATLTTTQVTTYTYNAANQLVMAKLDSSPDTWYYEFDDNGNQVRQVPNGLAPAAGEVRYTFNQRNRLVRLESHDGNAYQLQGEAMYDGDGQRVQTVAYMMGIPITTTYSLDRRSGNPLIVAGAGQETVILYGLFALGEAGSEWHYYLGDGQFSVRQLVNENGAPVLSRTYDPFGLVLQEAGSGHPLFGFRGAQGGGMGLLYVGGRYYDPRTGRFLSPNNDNFDPRRPGTLNPYLSALFLLPLLLVIARKDRRRSKIAIWLLGLSLVLTTTGCEPPKEEDDETSPPNPTEINTPPPTSTNTPTPTNTPPTPTASPSPTPGPTNTPSSTPSPTATCTPTPTATSTPTVTPIPTPPNLPPTSAGWRWEFVSSNVRTTQYSTDPLDVARFGGPLETPYGTNNQPISGVGELPNDFLRQVAYQGSGRLENGDLIQYAGPGAPIEPGWVPYRYFITPRTLCGGYPLAGNQTCAVPYETGAVALEPADRLVQVGVTVFIVELNLRIRINDTGSHVAPNQIDIYTGFHNDLNLYRHGLSVWRLVRT
jgi:RHS repeat-associated protein